MAKPTSNIDFDEVARIINSNFESHKSKIHDCCIKTKIIPLNEYNDALQKEYKDIEEKIKPSTTKPDPKDYVELFKSFDEYPSNLQKPKKIPIKENSRMNATMLKIPKQNASSTSFNTSKQFGDQLSAACIYNKFCKYTEKLDEFNEELCKQTTSKEYQDKLDNINIFARELDKLLQSDAVSVNAFTKDEEEKIKKISEYMEHFVYIQENQDLYSTTDGTEGNSTRVNDLVDIVTDALVAVNCYKAW